LSNWRSSLNYDLPNLGSAKGLLPYFRPQTLASVAVMKIGNILHAEKSGSVETVNLGEGETPMVATVILELK